MFISPAFLHEAPTFIAADDSGATTTDKSKAAVTAASLFFIGEYYANPCANARAISNESKILTAAVGLITEPEQAESIIAEGKADAVFLARAMLRNPRWAINAAEKLGVKIAWPLSLDRARTLN